VLERQLALQVEARNHELLPAALVRRARDDEAHRLSGLGVGLRGVIADGIDRDGDHVAAVRRGARRFFLAADCQGAGDERKDEEEVGGSRRHARGS